MAFIKVNNVAIRGIAACVPKNVEENKDLPFYASGEAEQVIAATGIERRHIATPEQTASDLCYAAAEQLIAELGWEKESIDLLAFCTQNPDYRNHPNSFVVHDKLGLPESTMCLDFFHGCPGWVVSMSAVCNLVGSGVVKRAILLDGDTPSKEQAPNNREERPLFGDAGSATALEYVESSNSICFNIGTLSADGMAIALKHGGYRNPFTMETFAKEFARKAGTLPQDDLFENMDAMDVFSFAITKVPKAIKKLCAEYEIDMNSVDYLVLHQANKVIIENIAKRLKIPMEKTPLSLNEYGNTTSVSVPITLVSRCANGGGRILACGFGTGLAWGAIYFDTENIVYPSIQEI